jgi:hypothetical protein
MQRRRSRPIALASANCVNQEFEMTSTGAKSLSVFIAVFSAAMSIPLAGLAAAPDAHDSVHPASADAFQVAQAMPANPGMGMGGTATLPGYTEQMQAMQQMHDKMLAAKTPDERNALMAEQMKLMHGGMAMMGRMGSTTMHGGSGHMAGADAMLEQRIDMMQSMMQMMMDRMQYAPAAK